MESQLTINTNNMKRTNLLLLSLCALGLIFTRCDFNWNFSRKYTIAIKQPDQAYIQSAELDSIWKSSYEYAVLIPEDTTISTYFHLIEALNINQPYNFTNTCLLYLSDAADDLISGDLGCFPVINKKIQSSDDVYI